MILFLPASTFATDRASPRSVEQAAERKAYLGRAALVRDDYRRAARLLTEALASPSLPESVKAFAFANRGVARTHLNELRGALQDFNAAIRLAPEEASLYNNRGNLLLRLELYKEAEKDFGTAMALLPSYGEAFNNRGNTRFLLEDYRGASEDYSRAIALMPMNAIPLTARGRAQFALERPAAAMRDFSRAIDVDPRHGQAYLHRGDALLALGRYEEAASDYAEAIELGFGTAHSYLGRASAYAFMGMKERALAEIDEARKRDPAIAEKAVEIVADLTRILAETEMAAAPAPALSPEAPALVCLNDRMSSNKPTMVVRASLLHPAPRSGADTGEATASDRAALGCGGEGRTQEVAFAATEPLNADQWKHSWVRGTGHIAIHPDYPDLRLRLETYGGGDPELLHWQPLAGDLSGIGLLHYYAGTTLKGVRMEYVAIVDTDLGHVLAIEPARWGERQARWVWRESELVVVDPQGLPSRVPFPGAEQPEQDDRIVVDRSMEIDDLDDIDGKDAPLPPRAKTPSKDAENSKRARLPAKR